MNHIWSLDYWVSSCYGVLIRGRDEKDIMCVEREREWIKRDKSSK